MRFESWLVPEEVVNMINQNIGAIEEWIEASQKAFDRPGRETRVFADSYEEHKRRPVKMKHSRPLNSKSRRRTDTPAAYKPTGFIGTVMY